MGAPRLDARNRVLAVRVRVRESASMYPRDAKRVNRRDKPDADTLEWLSVLVGDFSGNLTRRGHGNIARQILPRRQGNRLFDVLPSTRRGLTTNTGANHAHPRTYFHPPRRAAPRRPSVIAWQFSAVVAMESRIGERQRLQRLAVG